MPIITPVARPGDGQSTNLGQAPTNQDARARAIAMLEGRDPKAQAAAPKAETQVNQSQTSPVQNPSKVAVEELAAITEATKVPEAKVEGQTSNKETEATKTEPESAQFAQLARQAKAIRAAQIKLKADQEAFKAQQDALNAPKAPAFDPSKYIERDKLAEDPFSVLADLGLDYDKLTAQAVNQPTPEQRELNRTIQALQAEIKSLKDGQDKVNKTFEQQQVDAYKNAINTIKNETLQLISREPETYEAIKATNSAQDVVDLIESTFKDGLGTKYPKGTLLTVEEAAQMVEEELIEQTMPLTKLQKIQKRLQQKATPVAPAPEATAQQGDKETKQPQRTLTNAQGTQRQYSAKERAVLAGQYGPDWRNKVGA